MIPLLFASVSHCVSLLFVFCLGACAAAFANYCVDVWGWVRRYRSPWRRLPNEFGASAYVRPRLAFLPIVGWPVLARAAAKISDKSASAIPGLESKLFWLRPFVTEILFSVLVAWRFQSLGSELYDPARVWCAWGVEFVFYWLLLCASFIDLDDYVIPDAVTIPGAILGLLAATFLSSSLILSPTVFPLDLGGEASTFSFGAWIGSLTSGEKTVLSLSPIDLRIFVYFALVWTLWSFALLDRRFYPRFGLKKACAIFCRRIRRSSLTPIVFGLWILGLVLLFVVLKSYPYSPKSTIPSHVDFLVYSFLGLLVGTLMLWAVRIIGGASLGMEAMGFGDVIFTGMIGAFVGWQGVVVVFFMAPFFGLVFGILRRFFEKAPQIPYGPFLALSAVVYTVFRRSINEAMAPWFADPVFLLIIGGIGFFMLGFLLLVLRAVKSFLRRG